MCDDLICMCVQKFIEMESVDMKNGFWENLLKLIRIVERSIWSLTRRCEAIDDLNGIIANFRALGNPNILLEIQELVCAETLRKFAINYSNDKLFQEQHHEMLCTMNSELKATLNETMMFLKMIAREQNTDQKLHTEETYYQNVAQLMNLCTCNCL